jgi:hypothetical protein
VSMCAGIAGSRSAPAPRSPTRSAAPPDRRAGGRRPAGPYGGGRRLWLARRSA